MLLDSSILHLGLSCYVSLRPSLSRMELFFTPTPLNSFNKNTSRCIFFFNLRACEYVIELKTLIIRACEHVIEFEKPQSCKD